MKTFLVAVDQDATTAQRDAFTNYLRQHPTAGFWHDISSTWVIVERRPGALTAVSLRDKVMELMPKVTHLVIEMNPITYAAYSPETGHKWLGDYLNP